MEGRPLHLGDVWAMVLRRRWWIAIPLFAMGIGGFGLMRIWPYQYRSETVMLVQQQKISDQYVTVNTTSAQDRLEHLKQLILSRTRLEALIRKLNLYSPDQMKTSMDDILLSFRRRTQITPIKDGAEQLSALRIGFSASSAALAQRVTQTLTTSLIEENRRAGAAQSEDTTSFLGSQLETARQELERQEQKQRELKAAYIGELPEQLQANVQMMNSLETQIQAKNAAVDRAEQQKIYLESVLNQYQAVARMQASGGGGLVSAGHPVGPLEAARQTLTDMRKKLSDLRVTYTEQYPEVIRQKRLIADQEAEIKRLSDAAAAVAAEASQKGEPVPAAAAMDPNTIEARGRLNAANAELATAKRELAATQKALQQAQAKVNLMPLREQQFAEATREYEDAKANYQSLLKKKEQSALATDLVKQWDGAQFQQVEPASLPKHHEPPSRTQLVLVCWVLGLLFGVAIAAVREFTDRSIRRPEDMERYGQLPVMASIPVLRTAVEEKKRRHGRIFEMAMAAALVLVAAGAAVQALWFA